MKNTEIKIKTFACFLILFFFVFKVGIAQQTESNTTSKFSNGTIVSTDNATIRAEHRMTNKTYDEYMVGVYYEKSNANVNPAKIKTIPYVSEGVTYVQYNSENGAIKQGDLITSSSEAGVGMKATKSGMVLGIALEDATSATGLLKIRLLIQYVKQ